MRRKAGDRAEAGPGDRGDRRLRGDPGGTSFKKQASFCVHRGLCVGRCDEVGKKNAVGFIDRGTRREISVVPGTASRQCWNCRERFPLCPTEALAGRLRSHESARALVFSWV